VDNHGSSITSSEILTGKPGESINDLYSTENPLKIIERAGYRVVFNSFDNGDVQKFNDSALMPQVFTIGVSKKPAADQSVSVGNLTKEKLKEIKANISTSEKDDADYSKAMLELTNVVSSLYDMVAKPDKDEK